MMLLDAWKRQLEAESAMIELALKEGKSVQVVLYVDRKGEIGRPKITAS